MTPSEYRSDRGPTDSGSHHCSGDMYGGEPCVALAWVSCRLPLSGGADTKVSSIHSALPAGVLRAPAEPGLAIAIGPDAVGIDSGASGSPARSEARRVGK